MFVAVSYQAAYQARFITAKGTIQVPALFPARLFAARVHLLGVCHTWTASMENPPELFLCFHFQQSSSGGFA